MKLNGRLLVLQMCFFTETQEFGIACFHRYASLNLDRVCACAISTHLHAQTRTQQLDTKTRVEDACMKE